MLKININVQQKKENDDCIVKIDNIKNLDKASESEKNIGAAVFNAIQKALKELEQNK